MAMKRWWMARALMTVAALLLLDEVCAQDAIEQAIHVPIVDSSGHPRFLRGYLCRPPGVKSPRLVVINHGSTTIASERPVLPLASCHNEAVQWFLGRRYAVVQAWRLGYGATGGAWTEDFAKCNAEGYYQAGVETARQIGAIVDYAVSLPKVDPSGVVVIGHSGGGWGVIAYNTIANSHVSAVINMAGGRGGHYHGKPGAECGGNQLADAVARFAKAGSMPMLWIYASNDSYFSPALAQAMAARYVSAGGRVQFHETASFGTDGHALFFETGGSRLWGPLVQPFLDGDRRDTASP